MKAVKRDEQELRSSGVEWIGKIPKEWGLLKAKYVADFNPKVTIKFDTNLPIGYVPMDAVKLGYMEPLEHDYKSLSTGLTQFQEDDIIMAKVTPCFENGEIAIAKNLAQGVGFGSSELFVYRTTEINQKYFFYYLQQLGFVDKATSTMTGTGGLKRISSYFANNAEVTFPSVEEQQVIANYLDDRCSKIDAIIAEAKASIEEYKELKQAVIYEAVTKGLDKNIEMKDSGYEFIGNVPKHWMVCKLRHIGLPQNGISTSGDSFGSGYPFVSYGDVYKNYELPYEVSGLVESSNEDRERYSVQAGDIFFTRTSETKEEIGFSAVCEKTIQNATFAGFLIRVRPFNNKLDTKFAKYYFRSKHLRAYFVKEMNLVIRASLGQDLLKGAPVLLPPKNEQRLIAEYLENKCSTIDNIIEEKEDIIYNLESYKKSLIYEVVTGKRKVVA